MEPHNVPLGEGTCFPPPPSLLSSPSRKRRSVSDQLFHFHGEDSFNLPRPGSGGSLDSHPEVKEYLTTGDEDEEIPRVDGKGDDQPVGYTSVLFRPHEFPNTAFGIVMGLAANAIMWKSLGESGWANGMVWTFWGLGASCHLLFASIYIAKIVWHFDFVLLEFAHPVRCNVSSFLVPAPAAQPTLEQATNQLSYGVFVAASISICLPLSSFKARTWPTSCSR